MMVDNESLDEGTLPRTDVEFDLDALDWEKQSGLLPVIVQHAHTLKVLMLGYMDRDALQVTLRTRRVSFHSRSRPRLWVKGETSGNFLQLVDIETDCDRDTLLVRVEPLGPTCHLGSDSCFSGAASNALAELDARIASRVRERPAGSYTTRLLDAGIPRMAQKVGEEGVEVALAAVTGEAAGDVTGLLDESADLLYHLLVLLHARGESLDGLLRILAARAAST